MVISSHAPSLAASADVNDLVVLQRRDTIALVPAGTTPTTPTAAATVVQAAAGYSFVAPAAGNGWARYETAAIHFTEADKHLAQLRRFLLHDDAPLDVRVAASLVLLFGLPVTRLVRLQATDVHCDVGGVDLLISGAPVRLPPTLGHLVTALAAQPRSTAATAIRDGQPRYLFPGKPASRPASRHGHEPPTGGRTGRLASYVGAAPAQGLTSTVT